MSIFRKRPLTLALSTALGYDEALEHARSWQICYQAARVDADADADINDNSLYEYNRTFRRLMNRGTRRAIEKIAGCRKRNTYYVLRACARWGINRYIEIAIGIYQKAVASALAPLLQGVHSIDAIKRKTIARIRRALEFAREIDKLSAPPGPSRTQKVAC